MLPFCKGAEEGRLLSILCPFEQRAPRLAPNSSTSWSIGIAFKMQKSSKNWKHPAPGYSALPLITHSLCDVPSARRAFYTGFLNRNPPPLKPAQVGLACHPSRVPGRFCDSGQWDVPSSPSCTVADIEECKQRYFFLYQTNCMFFQFLSFLPNYSEYWFSFISYDS